MQKRSQYKRYTRSKAGNVMYFIILIAAGLFTSLPLIYCICTAFKPLDELLVFPPRFLVHRPTIENFVQIPNLVDKLGVPLSRYIFNSLFITVVATVLHIFVASMAAFVLSKSNLRFKKLIFIFVQLSLLYNAYTLAVPQYLIFSKMEIIDTIWVYILPAIPSTTGVFLIKQYMDSSVPDTLLEAARIDGAGVFKMYTSIIMPIIKPAWMTLLLLSFQSLWAVTPTGTVFSEKLKTLPYVLSSITAGGMARAGSAMAATVLMMIPPIFIFFISQSNVMETMSSAGMKG
ncbi:MAG: carbohydrate ABC transporter permease [Clostridia bacterium]|nr:carbohydrate ABC transporter permease [Clostridia bacterium]